MKGTLTWVAMVGLFAAANVVAAGVMMILGRVLQQIFNDPSADTWTMFIAGGAGVAAAILFLRGAMAAAPLGRKFYTRS